MRVHHCECSNMEERMHYVSRPRSHWNLSKQCRTQLNRCGYLLEYKVYSGHWITHNSTGLINNLFNVLRMQWLVRMRICTVLLQYPFFSIYVVWLSIKSCRQNTERLALLQKATQTHKENAYNVRTQNWNFRSMLFMSTWLLSNTVSLLRPFMDKPLTGIFWDWGCRVLETSHPCLRYSWTHLLLWLTITIS